MTEKTNEAQLLKSKEIKDYFVAIPEVHWRKELDRSDFEVIEESQVPIRTIWRPQVPTVFDAVKRGYTSKEEIKEALLEQRNYWKSKMAELNSSSQKYERYEKRVSAVSEFINSLSENYLELKIEDPKGDYEVHKSDLENVSEDWSEKISIEIAEDYSKVTVIAETEEALNQFKPWIDDSTTYYRKNFVDASMEVDSANQIEDEIQEAEK